MCVGPRGSIGTPTTLSVLLFKVPILTCAVAPVSRFLTRQMLVRRWKNSQSLRPTQSNCPRPKMQNDCGRWKLLESGERYCTVRLLKGQILAMDLESAAYERPSCGHPALEAVNDRMGLGPYNTMPVGTSCFSTKKCWSFSPDAGLIQG